eukprot:3754543-Rhodomonas_salina.1
MIQLFQVGTFVPADSLPAVLEKTPKEVTQLGLCGRNTGTRVPGYPAGPGVPWCRGYCKSR